MPTVFEPFKDRGTPLDEQWKDFKALTRLSYDKDTVQPYTRCRVILMNGIEMASFLFLHEFARMTYNEELKSILALLRRAEGEHQILVDWLNPANQTVLESTIGYEQLAVDLTANLARNEPDPIVKQQMDFALIEDFDHLFRYAHLMKRIEGGDATRITHEMTDIAEGRPTFKEHRHPYDTLRGSYNKATADIKTKLNQATITAGEQQTLLFYKTHGNMYADPLARQLYAEIAQIEEDHVTAYESLADASMTWLERLVLYQANEAYNYLSCHETESHPEIKEVWKQLYHHELEHFAIAAELLRKHEGKNAHDFIPERIAPLVVLEPNKDYVKRIIREQKDWQSFNMEIMPESQLPPDWPSFAYRKRIRGAGFPSEQLG
ncbi:MAG: hypothetical protein V2A77_04135 [Pseudomonadota bacterium]